MKTAQHTPENASFWNSVGIIAEREIIMQWRSKAYKITLLVLTAVILVGSIFGPRLGDIFSSTTQVAVTEETQQHLAGRDDVELTVVGNEKQAEQLVDDEKVDAAVVPDASGESVTGLKVLALREVPTELVQGLSATPSVELLDPNAPNPIMRFFISFGFGFIFFMSVMMFGNVIAQSVLEEKQSRIVEILLATVPAKALLAGKVLGRSVTAMAHILIYAAAGLVGIMINGAVLDLTGLGGPILVFVLFFAVAFVMFASLYAGLAAMVSRPEDLGTATMPLTLIMMFPYLLSITVASNAVAMKIMTFVPFTAPIAVPVRMYQDNIAVWEIVVSFLILMLTTAVGMVLAGRIYSRSILQTGKAVKYSQVFGSQKVTARG